MMLLIGRFEERVAACFAGNEIPGFIHLEWRKAVGERVSPGETLLVIETEKAEVDRQLRAVLATIPNMTHPEAPVGNDNKVISQWGEPRKFDFTPKDHVALAEALDLVDFEAGSSVAGQKFYFLKNEGALLEIALIHYAMGTLLKEGYTPVITPDLYPTILEMVGFPTDVGQPVDGESLVGLLRGEEGLDREAIYWHFPHYSNHGMQSPGGAIRRGELKLIEYFENGTLQLFHLGDDPGEQHDLAGEQPEVARTLQTLLQGWRQQVGSRMMKPKPISSCKKRSHPARRWTCSAKRLSNKAATRE